MKSGQLISFATLMLMTSCKDKEQVKINYDASGQSIQSIQFQLTNNLERVFIFNENGGLDQQYTSGPRGMQSNFMAYQENGLIDQMATYLDDTLHGLSLTYYKNGHVRDEFIYENGSKKMLVQFNRNGSKRGEELYYEDSAVYRRVWRYDSLLNVTSIFTSICTLVKVQEVDNNDSLKIDFHLPLDNEEFSNNDLTLAYSIEFYKNGRVVKEEVAQDLRIDNGLYSKSFFIPETTDSLVITDQVSHIDQQFEPCRMRIVFDSE
ncbi:MAG: hypothetical protein IPL46_09665 [Saprospiraceae bacterium]|nr:hypothetical protein [Saprospiraceae bacterium]